MSVYLERYAWPKSYIQQPPRPDTNIIVTIPCYNEQSLIPCFESLLLCELPAGSSVEVIAIVNESEDEAQSIVDTNKTCYKEACAWIKSNSSNDLRFFLLYEQLPKKHAGVGLARKIAMDEAVKRFEAIGKSDGVIVCYDVDCTCDPNYLKSIDQFFRDNSKCPGASIYFEHPTSGDAPDENYKAIIDYELFLRYYVNALRYAGHMHAYETIGSSMAVRADAYQKQGGMNRRKAGEDFYFLQKIIPMGHFGEINNTRVIPSPRKSERVPFGTGRAVNQWIEQQALETYALQGFDDLKDFLQEVESFYQITEARLNQLLSILPPSISQFLTTVDFKSELQRINKNANSLSVFYTQFYAWFDGFKALKYIHFARDHFYPNQPVFEVARDLIEKIYSTIDDEISPLQLLQIYRELDREYSYFKQ